MVLHGLPRVTQDIDIFVKPVQDNVERLTRAFDSVFHDESINEITLEELSKYPVIRYGTQDGFCIDILIKIGDVFTYRDLEYNTIKFEGHKIKVASIETLYKLKKDTTRPIDKTDTFFLEELMRTREKK
ncbi:MAG: hypothetical protein A3K22_00520 [Deltaproteobacteria bacterium RBG_16_42_7]|nr:MAG: hypothetical protein A3K22_00520 [Deltaproteobacteria bacterium RBG_16_42_7]